MEDLISHIKEFGFFLEGDKKPRKIIKQRTDIVRR